MKSLLKLLFGFLGYKIQNQKLGFTMNGALNRCKNRGLVISTVIDVGASDGRWSENCLEHFPEANYILIEALEDHIPSLEKFKEKYKKKKINIIPFAASDFEGTIYFKNENLFGGLASKNSLNDFSKSVKSITIDNVIKSSQLPAPFLIKLDTHGFEIPILNGAMETLKKAHLIIIEVYNQQLTSESLKFYELCIKMDEFGFRPIELVDFARRPFDNSFWQMDIFFIPKDSNEFKYSLWK